MSTQKYFHTEHTDRLIRECYASGRFGRRDAAAQRTLCARLGWPKTTIYRRAIALGVAQPRVKEPHWSPAEMALLEQHAHKTADVISRIMRRRGYQRTPTAIGIRRKRFLAGIQQARADAGLMSATAAAPLLGVDAKTISYWIKRGWLTAKRRGTDRSDAQGGDEYEISERDIRDFVIHYTAHVPFQRADKYWLVDLLAGSHHGAKAASA